MATLQEHYNLINEGKGNKEQFLRQARQLFPQYINQYSDFNTATQVLKSKQIISEAKLNVVTKGFDIYDWKKILAEEVKAEEKETSKGVIDTQKHAYDNTDMKNADNINFNEIMKGFYAELKDPKNHDKTGDEIKAIVIKNLAKDILYYTKDGMFGEKGVGYTTEAPGLGEPKEPKGKFKSSGYGDLDTDKKIEKVKANVQDSLGDKEAKTSDPKKVKEMSVTPQNSAGVKKMKAPGTEKTMKLQEVVTGENPYFDTDPSDGDADDDRNMAYGAENYYDKGKKAFEEGDLEKAQEYYEQALDFGSWIGWTEKDLPPYESKSLNENEAVYDQIADLERDLMLAKDDEQKAEIEEKIKTLSQLKENESEEEFKIPKTFDKFSPAPEGSPEYELNYNKIEKEFISNLRKLGKKSEELEYITDAALENLEMDWAEGNYNKLYFLKQYFSGDWEKIAEYLMYDWYNESDDLNVLSSKEIKKFNKDLEIIEKLKYNIPHDPSINELKLVSLIRTMIKEALNK